MGTVSTVVNKAAERMLVDESRIHQPDLVALSANCRVAVRPQMYRESRVFLRTNLRCEY